jgi:hypothetical protein
MLLQYRILLRDALGLALSRDGCCLLGLPADPAQIGVVKFGVLSLGLFKAAG